MLLEQDRNRMSFMEFMKVKGIQTSIHYPPIHRFTDYRSGYHNSYLSITDNVEGRIVTLPLYPNINREQIHYTIDSIREWIIAQKSDIDKAVG
jgi:dTDP-4-amino-4,6-dideoxygalactose transaminase